MLQVNTERQMNIRIEGITEGEGETPVKGEEAVEQKPLVSFLKTIHKALVSDTAHSCDFCQLVPSPLSFWCFCPCVGG